MNAFDKVIGYETIKNELRQICDMIHNKEVYEKLGAKLLLPMIVIMGISMVIVIVPAFMSM